MRKTVSIRLSEQERERLEQLAQQEGVSMSEYIRGVVMGRYVRKLSESEVAEYIRRLYRTMV